ncbi:MAG: CerR family C-terminal domain-containing protein [Chitinivorax sp.]
MPNANADPRAEDTRKRLIEAGIGLFGQYGYDAVTTRQLAETAGVNQAAIPYHFGGKEGVYRAVAGQLASASAERMQPVLSAVRQLLAQTPERAAVEQALLDTTLALARVSFEPAHRAVWMMLLNREQFHPSSAFDDLYGTFVGPIYRLLGQLIGRLTAQAPTARDTTLLVHAYLGQLIGFTVARTSLARSLGEPAAAATDDIDSAIGAVERFSRMAIRGMRAGPCD